MREDNSAYLIVQLSAANCITVASSTLLSEQQLKNIASPYGKLQGIKYQPATLGFAYTLVIEPHAQ